MSAPHFGSDFVTAAQISGGVPFVTIGGPFCNANRPRLAEAPIFDPSELKRLKHFLTLKIDNFQSALVK